MALMAQPATGFDPSELDKLISQSVNEVGTPKKGVMDSVDDLLDRAKFELGQADLSASDRIAGATERTLLSAAKLFPSIWQQADATGQESVRRSMFVAKDAMNGNWKGALSKAAVANMGFMVWPEKRWPDAMKAEYDDYKKSHPLAVDQEGSWSSKIFNAPAEKVRKEVRDLMERHPEMQGEQYKGSMDLLKNPSKLAAQAIESFGIMAMSFGALALTKSPSLSALIMYGAEGEDAYESALASGATLDEARWQYNIYGVTASAIEMLQMQQAVKVGKGIYKAVLNRTAKKAFEQAAKKGLKSLTLEWFKNTIAESAEEMTQGTAQELLAKYGYGQPIEGGIKGFADRRLTETLVTMAAMAPMGGASAVIDVTGGYYSRDAKTVARDKEQLQSVQDDVGFKSDDYEIPRELGRRHAKVEQLVQKIFGKQVVWFKPTSQESPASNFNGIAPPGRPDLIMLNTDGADSLQSAGMHDSIHQLRVDDPGAYDTLRQIISENLRAKEYMAEEIRNKLKRVGYKVDDDFLEEEIVADVIGRLSMDDAFLDRVAGERPSILTRLNRSFKKALDAVVKARQSSAVRSAEAEASLHWMDAYISDMTALTKKVESALQRVVQSVQVAEKVAQREAEKQQQQQKDEAVATQEGERAKEQPPQQAPEKMIYTNVPTEWTAHKTLVDWGRKGLRTKGNVAVKVKGQPQRKSFVWSEQFERVPVRLAKSTMDFLKSMTDEIWKVEVRKGEDYYLVPRKALEEAKKRLPESAFRQGPSPVRANNQIIVDIINSGNVKNQSKEEIASTVLMFVEDQKIPESELTELGLEYLYLARGESVPVVQEKSSQLYQDLVEASKHPEMTQEEYNRLKNMVSQVSESEEIMKKRRPGKREKAKLALAPKAEEVSLLIDKYRPEAMSRRASGAAQRRESGEGLRKPEEETTPAARKAGQIAGETEALLAGRGPVVSTRYAVNKLIGVAMSQKQSPATINNLKAVMKSFVGFLNARNINDIQDVTPEVIRLWIKGQVNKGKKASSINQSTGTVKSMFEMLKSDGDIKVSPFDVSTIERLKEGQPVKKVVSRETVQTVVESIEGTPVGVRDRAIILTLFDTGLRASELSALTEPGTTAVQKVTGKGKKQRQVFITQRAMDALDDYIKRVRSTLPNADKTSAVFLNLKGEPLTRFGINQIIKKHFAKHGVKLSPHNLRASFATDMIEHGMDLRNLQTLMGHESLDTTAKYLKLSMEYKREAVKKLPHPSVAKKPISTIQQRLIEGKTKAINLKTDLKQPGYDISNGWVLEDGTAYPVYHKGAGVIFTSHRADAERIGGTVLGVLKDGAVRVSVYHGRVRTEISFEAYEPRLLDSHIDTMRRIAMENASIDSPNDIFISLHGPNGTRGYAMGAFQGRAELNQAFDYALDYARKDLNGTKPHPSVAKKEQRIYSKGRSGIRTAIEIASGKRALPTPVDNMTEEELLKMKLRAERKAADLAYKQGLKDSRTKLDELKLKVKTAAQLRKEFRKWVQDVLPMDVRGKMLTALEKVKDEKSFDKALEQLKTEIDRLEKRKEIARLKKFQKTFKKRYGRRKPEAYKEGGKFKVLPKFSAIFEKIFDKLTTKRAATPERIEELEELLEFARTERQAAELEAQQKGVPVDSPFVRFELDKVIEALQNELKKVSVDNMTADQIHDLTDALITLEAAYQWERGDLKQKWDTLIDLNKFHIIGEVMSGWRKPANLEEVNTKEIGKIRKFFALFGRYNYNLQTLVQIVSGGKQGVLFRRLARDVQSGVDRMKASMFGSQDLFGKLANEEGITSQDYSEWSDLAKTRPTLPAAIEAWVEKNAPGFLAPHVAQKTTLRLEVLLDSGKRLKTTVAQALSILMHARNAFNYKALKAQGIVFQDMPYNVMKLTDADIERIRQAVPPKALKMLDVIAKVISAQQDAINAVSRLLEGFDLANVDNYWHIRRFMERAVRGKQQQNVYQTVEGRNSWKQRVGSDNPVIIGDAFNELMETLAVGSEYIGLAEPIRVARQLTGDRVITKKVTERGYAEYWKDIIKQLEAIQDKQKNQEWFERMYGQWARSVTRAVFGYNLRVSAQQYASVFLAASELGFKSLRSIRFVADKNTVSRAARWSPFLRERFMGAIGRELGDVAKVGGVMRFLTGQDQMINLPTFLVRLFDRMAITDIWRMVEQHVSEMPEYSGVSLEALIKDAELPRSQRQYQRFKYSVVRIAEEVIRATQPTWDVVDRSRIGSVKNPMVRALTMFHSQREKLVQMLGISNSRFMNELNDIRRKYKLKTLKEASQTKEGVEAIGRVVRTYSIVLTNTAIVKLWAIGYGIALLKRDDDWKDWATAVVADIPGMFYFGDLARDVVVSWSKKARGKKIYQLGAIESPPLRAVSTARAAAYEMGNLLMMTTGTVPSTDDEIAKQLTKTLDQTWEAANYSVGLPFQHMTDIVKAQTKPKAGLKKYKGYKKYKKYKE